MMSEPPAHRRSLVLASLCGLRIDSLDDVALGALFLLQRWERQRNCASMATSSRDSVSSVAAS